MPTDRFIRVKEVLEATGLKRSTLFKLVRDGRFPRQRQLTDRATGWLASEVQQWMAERPVVGG